jgi:hypothetical protein
LLSNPVAASSEAGDQADQEVPLVLPPVNKERININRKNWRQVEGMIPGRRQTVEELESEIKKLQDRQEKFQA